MSLLRYGVINLQSRESKMMTRLTLALFSFLFILFSLTAAHAQDGSESSEGGATNETIEIDKGRLDSLIGTLENEAQRTEFLDKLKALSEAKAEQEQKDAGLLDLSLKTGGLINSYEQFVADLGISEGLFAQLAATAGVALAWFVLTMIVRKLAHLLRDRLNRVRDHFELKHDRFRLYARYIRFAGYILVSALALYTLGVIWNVTEGGWPVGETGQMILVKILNVFLITMLAIMIWEFISTFIENYVRNLDSSHSSRLLTLIPIVRNVLLVAFVILFTLVLLSEVGVNIVPLLAGAGVLGLAIGLGAQTMIKDFLTGFTIIIEDLIQVGDVAKVGDKIGVVEKITIRKVQLRDLAGIVYTVPFSEITIVENWTKEFSF